MKNLKIFESFGNSAKVDELTQKLEAAGFSEQYVEQTYYSKDKDDQHIGFSDGKYFYFRLLLKPDEYTIKSFFAKDEGQPRLKRIDLKKDLNLKTIDDLNIDDLKKYK